MQHINPIQSLFDRILQNFSSVDENLVFSNISNYIQINNGVFSTPKADFEKNEIILNKQFLCFLWCLTYIFYDIAQNKTRIAKEISSTFRVLNSLDPEVQQLDQLFDWAYSLKSNYNDIWPNYLPMPTIDSYEIKVTNIIFIDAITYIMFHEVAHIVSGHWETYKPIKTKLENQFSDPLTEEEKLRSKALEQEADAYAFDKVITSCESDESRFHKLLAMVIAELAGLFAIKKGHALNSATHASLHIRIFNTRMRASFEDGEEFWLNQVMNVGLSLFCKLHGISYEDRGFKTDREILDYFFDLLEMNGNKKLQL